MGCTKSGVPTWAKTNAPGTGQGEQILKTNEQLFLAFNNETPELLPCIDVDTLSDDAGDVTVLYDFGDEILIVTI